MKGFTQLFVYFLFTTFLAACGGGGGSNPTPPSEKSYVSIMKASSTQDIHVGTSVQFTVYGVNADSTLDDITSSVSWASSNANVASVSSSGVVTGNAVGTGVNITASYSTNGSSLSVTMPVSVVDTPIVAITISPTISNAFVGQSIQFVATGIDQSGLSQDISLSATWTSNSSAVLVTSNGLANAKATGSATITASIQNSAGQTVSNQATLTVSAAALNSIYVSPVTPSLAVGINTQFTATGVLQDGSTVNLTQSPQLSWSSNNANLNIIKSTGLATGLQAGSATVTATYNNSGSTMIGSTQATVTNATITGLVISPNNTSTTVGNSIKYTATAAMSDGTSADLTNQVQWSVNDPTKATIDRNGLLSTLVAGQINVTAQCASNCSYTQPQSVLLQIVATDLVAWSWQGGSKILDDEGTSGIVPAARAHSAFTVDSYGNFWLFGGELAIGENGDGTTIFSDANDLWRFSATTGIFNLVNPGTGTNYQGPAKKSDGSVFFDSTSNSIYLFGGWQFSQPSTIDNSLWQFNVVTNSWSEAPIAGSETPLDKGSSSYPSAREGQRIVAGTDPSGMKVFYMFGGMGIDPLTGTNSTFLNDLWEFNPTNQSWTMLIPNTTGQSNYGTQFVPSISNIIPGRSGFNMWVATDKIWIFGGTPVINDLGYAMNDLWSIDIGSCSVKCSVTWVSGEDVTPYYANFGSLSPNATPGGRIQAGSDWIDAQGKLWMYGGYGPATLTNGGDIPELTNGSINEVWMFDPGSYQWFFISGDLNPDTPVNFGPQDTPAGTYPNNYHPEGSMASAAWFNPNDGSLWLFGGWSNQAAGMRNDLWRYGVCKSTAACI